MSDNCRKCALWERCPCGKAGHENGTSVGYSIGECKMYDPIEIARQYAPKFDKPVVDMVAVVRCKDCRWWDNHLDDCAYLYGLQYPEPEDYCSHGERANEV